MCPSFDNLCQRRDRLALRYFRLIFAVARGSPEFQESRKIGDKYAKFRSFAIDGMIQYSHTKLRPGDRFFSGCVLLIFCALICQQRCRCGSLHTYGFFQYAFGDATHFLIRPKVTVAPSN
jgi:hypothetical protein